MLRLDERVATGEEIEFCNEMIKREMPTRDHLELKSPDVTFTNKIEIDLGGITCVVEHVGGVHATRFFDYLCSRGKSHVSSRLLVSGLL